MKVPPQLPRLYQAARDWGGQHPTVVDLGWALLMLSLAWVQPRVRPTNGFAFWPLLLQLALVLPLTLRRRAPFPVFLTTAAVAFLQWVTTGVMPADAAVLFALGTVAVHCPGRQAAAAFGVSELGALLAAWRLTPDPAQEPDRTPGTWWDCSCCCPAWSSPRWRWGWPSGPGAPRWRACGNVRARWSSSGTSRPRWRSPGNARASHGRCTTSSRTTCP
ncbi:hypothetical protein ACFQZC_05310 [Streptacidiphilus monticola]